MFSYSVDGSILKINAVNLSFGDKVVLRNVRGEIRNLVRPGMQQGQITALLGPSGIGKTQLFRIMAGLEVPEGIITGNVTIGTNDIPVNPGLVGVVSQKYPLFAHHTILGNLTVAGRQAKLPAAQAREKALEYLKLFDLLDKQDQYPTQLSGGQRQRVAIAQQLMCSEHVVLMDEPFTGLDPLMVDRTVELFQRIALLDEYNTIVVVTHEVSTAIAVADHIWVLGRDRQGAEIVPGAYIKHEYNLVDMDLAWRPDIRSLPKFQEFAAELRHLFKDL
jgi:NitT/TauT family transport system ATP-binding protein